MAWYTGKVFRGVDYSPSWKGWTQGPNGLPETRLQTFDSDMFNDAFASLWGKSFQQAPAGDTSAPIQNTIYRDDLGKIASDGFNLIRVYDWGIARGTAASQNGNFKGLDHINFLKYAEEKGLTVVVPVSDYFLTNDAFAWNNVNLKPQDNYAFSKATTDIQSDLNQFIASITDPSTGKIFKNVHIAVGNEGDLGEGGVYHDPADPGPPNTNAADFLSRTIWWIKNLHEKINGAGGVNGPNGDIVPITATFANGDQGATKEDPTHPGKWGSWMEWVISGVQAGQHAPVGWNLKNFIPPGQTFGNTVTGLATADPSFASYYYNSFNIGQITKQSITDTLALYDKPGSPWPGASVADVPLLLMEVFSGNRDAFPNVTPPSVFPQWSDQSQIAVDQVTAIEKYLALNNADTGHSTTNLIGYNYFQFSDEPAKGKFFGLYQFGTAFTNAQTGTTSIFYDSRGGYPNLTFPVGELVATPGPGGQGTLVGAWTAKFPHALQAHNDAYVVVQGGALATAASLGVMGNDVSEAPGVVALHSGVAHGLLGLGFDGAVTYAPNPGFSGIDSFSYSAYGEYGTQDSGQATIHVVPVIVGPTSTTLNLLALTAQEQVAALYVGFLGRAADAGGFGFWVDQLNHNLPTQGPTAVFANIAQSFAASAEAQALHPLLAHPGTANEQDVIKFVEDYYRKALEKNRQPGYWDEHIKKALQDGTPVGQVVVDMISGTQETAASKDVTTLMSKVAVSLAYVEQQLLHGIVWNGASDIAAATTLLDSVTADPQSLLVGIRNADALIDQHA